MTMTTLAAGALAAGMLAGPCPEGEGLPLAIDRQALHEIMIHDAHGGNLEGRSILGVIFGAPIGLRYALDGELLPEGDLEAVKAVDLAGVETAWVLGSGEDDTVVALVPRGAEAPAGGLCMEVMTLPIDREYLAEFEALGGPGTPGLALAVMNNVVLSHAASRAMGPEQQEARRTRVEGVASRATRVAAPWLRDLEEYEDHPGLYVAFIEFRGDARDLFPNR
jgi:hypothetical protein